MIRRQRTVATWLCAAILAVTAAAAAELPAGVALSLDVEPARATVGEPLTVTLTVDLPAGVGLETDTLGPALGHFTVIDEHWSEAEPHAGGERRHWVGHVAAYRTGALELPALRLNLRSSETGPLIAAATEPRTITIESVLDPAESEPELGDLKPPAAVPPDYAPLVWAAGILLLLLLAALLAWWLHRRYASRLAAVAPPDDPFHRTPPEVWIYAELQKLLERRLAEEGLVDQFFAELSRLLKTYLSGRYRVELLDGTTEEVPERLRQSGAEEAWVAEATALLAACDLVKFARRRPGVEDCRQAIERAYRIVDGTKPRLTQAAEGAA